MLSNNNMVKNSKWLWVPSLYFGQGVPFFVIMSLATIMYKNFGVSNSRITFFVSLFFLPWVLKPLWSPILEVVANKRCWLLVMQVLLSVLVFCVVVSLHSAHYFSTSLVLFFLIAFAGATYDIASDGFYLLHLSAYEQSFFVGIRNVFYQVARLCCEGCLVVLVGYLTHSHRLTVSWQITYLFVVVILLSLALWHQLKLPSKEQYLKVRHGWGREIIATYRAVLGGFLHSSGMMAFVIFLLIYNATQAQLMRIVPLFMLSKHVTGGLALSTAQVGLIYGGLGVGAIVIGAVLAGVIIARFTVRCCLIPMTALMLIADSGFILLSYFHLSLFYIVGVVVVMQFAFGMVTSVYMACLLRYANSETYKTTFFAVCSALMALGFMVFGAFSGWLQQYLGYGGFFVWIFAVNLLILFYVVYMLVTKCCSLNLSDN